MAALLITAGADPHAENLDPAEDTRDEEEEFGLDMDLSLPTIQEQNSSGTSPLDLAVGNEKVTYKTKQKKKKKTTCYKLYVNNTCRILLG